jgi:serine/threonine protein kinase/DNA-binding winged helix-turn-helix (wHTH) protein/tetratricopeptide (TPR) repeat protein
MKTEASTRLRLGAFELNLKTGELCAIDGDTDRRKVLLQEQPFRVLQILIDCGGEIATREEIKKRLWPNDTIVDFDHNINVAIGTLRRAFGDSAANPSYIETIARRGYRLMLPAVPLEPLNGQRMAEFEDISPMDDAEPRAPDTALIGKKVSHFRVLEVIGGGGMGMVYKAEDLKLGRTVALKFLPEELADDPMALRRFEREAQTASSLNHPNICTIFGIEEFEGQPLIVMELLDGVTLRDRLAAPDAKKIPLDQLLEIAMQTCEGLQAAHSKGVVHRDIKPANIFLTSQGPAKILDFGLAKLVDAEEQTQEEGEESEPKITAPAKLKASVAEDANLTRTGMTMGTASYMSPEQIRRERLDARTDLFSFGLVLYEMVTGQRAFSGENATGIHEAVLNRTPIPVHDLNPAAPPALEAVVVRALKKDRTQRYQSAAEMRADLELVPTPRKLRMRRIRNRIGIAAALLLIAGGAVAMYHYLTRYQLSATDTIVIADLTNQTSDAVLDDALNLALPVEIAQTPFLQVLAQDKVRDTMKQLGHPEVAKVTPEIAREVCLKTNSRAVVASSIADAGNHFHIELTGINCQSGKVFAQSEQNAALRNEIVHALGVAGAQLRGRMGEPNDSLKKFNQPLELATSASPEALQLVAKAFRRHRSPDFAGTISLYERAIDIDPSFALAYASAGTVYFTTGNFSKAVANETKAYELRGRLTGQLKYLAETLYYAVGQGDLRTALPIYQEWVRTFPLDGVAHNNFGATLFYLGRYDDAAAEARLAQRLMPQLVGSGAYFDQLTAEVYGNRLEEAKATFSVTQARGFDDFRMHDLRHLIAFLQHDDPAMRQELTWLRIHNKAALSLGLESFVLGYYGRFNEARRLLPKNSDFAAKKANASDLRILELSRAREEAEVEDWSSAQRLLKDVGLSDHSRRAQLSIALTSAESGDIERAEKVAETMNQQSPQDTLMQFYYLPTIRASIELHRHSPAAAIEILRPAKQYEEVVGDFLNSMYPAYFRGLAYLQLGQGQAASAEFQKLLDHPAIVGRNVTGALAHLQLGRAQAMMGDKAAARKSYKDFLTLWKDADPDIPIYKKAKAEYAALQ